MPNSLRPTPIYAAEWHPVLRMWAVSENNVPIAFTPEEANTRFLAQAANSWRRILAGVGVAARLRCLRHPVVCPAGYCASGVGGAGKRQVVEVLRIARVPHHTPTPN